MPDYYHNLEEKSEDAFGLALVAHHGGVIADNLISGGLLDGVNIYLGDEDARIKFPSIQIFCESLDPIDKDGDVFFGQEANLVISIKSNKKSTRSEHSRIVGLVRDFVWHTDLVTQINAADVENFKCLRCEDAGSNRSNDDEFRMLDQNILIWCNAIE